MKRLVVGWDWARTEVLWKCSCGDDRHLIGLCYYADPGDIDTYFDLSVGTSWSWRQRLRATWRSLSSRESFGDGLVLTPRQLAELHAAIGKRLEMLMVEEQAS